LYKLLIKSYNPFDFISKETSVYRKIYDNYNLDVYKAKTILPEIENDGICVIILPSEQWSRRVIGVYANLLMYENKNRAHALMILNKDKSYLVGVRAPYNNKKGADKLCAKFGGGGRKGAAGINNLPNVEKNNFIKEFRDQYNLTKLILS